MCVLDVSARFAWSVRGVCTAWYVQQISCVCVRAMCVCKRSCVCPCDVCAQGSSCVWRGEWCDEACMILTFTTNPNDVHHIRHEVLRVTRTFTTVVTACLFSQGSVTHTTSKNPRRKRLPSNGDVGPFAYEHMRVPQMARLISVGQTRSSRQPQLLQPLGVPVAEMQSDWTTIDDPPRTKCGEELPSAESCFAGFEEPPLDGMTRAESQARVLRLAEELKPEPTRQHGTRSDSKLTGTLPRDRSPWQY